MSMETLALLIIGLVILVVILLFVRGGFGEIGRKFGSASSNVSSQTTGVTNQMSSGVTELTLMCDISAAPNCVAAGGQCRTAPSCASIGGYDETGFTSCAFPTICCCKGLVT